MHNQKPLIGFLSIAFGGAWILFLLPLAFGPPGTPSHQAAALVFWSVAMWAPGLGAIIATRFIADESLSTLHLRHLGPKPVYLWAWLVPPILALITGSLTPLFGAGRFDPTFPLIRAALATAPGGPNVSPAVVIAIQSALALTLFPLFNSIFAMGEELGWRGFLLPRLLPLGQGRAILASGVIWGIWHAPAIAQGHNYPGHPILGSFLMIVFCVLVGAIFSWLYLQTRSPWVAALGHGSLNATAGLPLLLLTDVNTLFGGPITSIIGLVTLAAFVGWLVVSHRLPVATESRQDVTAQPVGA